MKYETGDEGQTLIEYVLVLVLIAVVVVIAYLLVEPVIGDIIEQVKGSL